jgi:hypothetical protein
MSDTLTVNVGSVELSIEGHWEETVEDVFLFRPDDPDEVLTLMGCPLHISAVAVLTDEEMGTQHPASLDEHAEAVLRALWVIDETVYETVTIRDKECVLHILPYGR